MYSPAKKTLIAFVALAMLMPGVYLAFRPAPAQAQWFNTTILDVGQVVNWIIEIGVSVAEGMVYKTLKNLAKSLAHKIVETTMTEFATGEKGQEPFWSTKAWDKEMKDLGSNALGFGLEGMAIGFERAHENSKMSEMNKKADSLSSGSEDDKAKAGNLKKEADQMKANQKKRDEAYRRGKSGGVSDEVASVVGWLCNPSMNPNISLKIALGIGNLGEDPDAKPLCDVNQMAQNWGALYDQFRTFDPSSINGWQMLGNLFDTDSSEVGVAFNANNVFFDVHEKKVVNDQIEAFVKALTGKDKTDEAGNILTPGDTVREWSKNNIMKGSQDSSDPTEKMTGRLVADAADIVGTFVDSLLSKGSEYLQKGLVRNIKEWQSASKDKEFDKLTDALDKNAQIKEAEDNAAAAQTRALEAEDNATAAQTLSILAVAEARELAQSATADPGNSTLAAQAVAAQTEATAAQAQATQTQVQATQTQAQATQAQAQATQAQAQATQAQAQATQAQAQAVEAQRTVVAITTPSLVAVNPAETAVLDAIYNPDAAPSHGGIAAVRQYASKLTRVESMGGGILDVLAQLRSTECTFSANACVLGDAFANAVQQKMTVKEAMEAFRRGENAGMNPDGVFGFENQPRPSSFREALQPTFQTNFPYNSLVVLRKYRVVPVSWELAALYIKDHKNVCGSGKSCTLQDMVSAFDDVKSPFYRLVDPNWVLKLPAVFCAMKGYGPLQEKTKDTEQTICKNDTNGDGIVCCDKTCLSKDFDGKILEDDKKEECIKNSQPDINKDGICDYFDLEEQMVVRTETCLDEQTCLDDDAQGKCKPKMYGYCMEEKKLWRFNGTQCNRIYASCDTFTDKDTKTVGFYLKDSIPSSNCTAETAGCQWYSTTRFTRDARTTGTPGDYVVKDWNSAEKVYFTPKAQICSDKAEGCRGLVDVSLANMDTVQAPRAVLIGQPTWNNPPLPSWSWLKDNNYFSVADIDLSSTAEQLAAKNYDIYFVDSSNWSVGTAGGDAIRKKLYALWHDYGKNVITVGNDTYGGDIYPVTGHIENGGYAASPDADHLITRKHRTATDIGSHSDTGTAITQARQGFTILYRKTGEQNKILGIIGESQRGGIWFHDQNGALTSNQNGKEILANAVKYMTAISEAKAYVRVAPDYLGCNEIDKPTGAPDTWKPSYRREECKSFALHCSQNYVGCELYTPKEAGGFPIAATGPQAGCKEACAGLTQYSIQKTRIESQLGIAKVASSAAFIPTSPTIQQCAVADVGCDEFTNILTGAEAEQRAYFKEIRRCEKKPEHPENVTVFYSPAGSNFGGYSLDKFFVKADSDGAPICFPGESCTCTEEEYYTQFINPAITTINCRQMYVSRKSTGFFEPEYYQMDKLIYYTDDCKDYRRTLSGANGTIYKISPSMSQICPAASAACREFRDPTAGNVVMTDYSNFEDNTSQGWSAFSGATALSAKASNESESIGNHSLEVKNTTTGAVTFEKNGLLLLGDMSYLGGLSIKVPAASQVSMEFLGFENADGQQVKIASASSSIPAGTWRYLTFAVQRISDVRPTVQGNSGVRIIITPVSVSDELTYVLLDAITLKQATGVIYAVDDSWTLPDECLADPSDKTTADVTQIGCKLYTDRGGAQAVFRDVAWLCPNEMVGCKNYTRNETNIYLVKDTAKKCLPADNGCTAYGMPTLDIAGNVSKRALSRGAVSEQWTARYLKVAPEDARAGGVDDSRGICWSGTNGSGAIGCRAYHVSGQGEKYFKASMNMVCQWRAAKEEEIAAAGTNAATVTNLKVNGVWYYKTCKKKTEGTIVDTGVKCTIDKDCQTIGDSTDVCTEAKTQCEQNMLKSCPSNQKTCRKIMDPECVSGRLRSDYGRGVKDISCQSDYYYLADATNKGECGGKVDIEGGCLLFDDANAGEKKMTSKEYYSSYFSKGLQPVTLNNAIGVFNNASTNDANALMKVRLDRICKTWLECADYIVDPETNKTVCSGRVPCDKRGTEGSCANYIFRDSEGTTEEEKVTMRDTMQMLQSSVFNAPTSSTSRIQFASLAGMARPDLIFPAHRSFSAFSTADIIPGHDSLFRWAQKPTNVPSPDNSKQLLLAVSVTPSVDVVNSCRVRPRSDAPEIRYKPKLTNTPQKRDRIPVNSCDYENKKGDRYQGIDGYCIEPYPKFTDTYFGSAVLGLAPARDDWASFGFHGACLNWYPSDRTESQGVLEGSATEKAPTDIVNTNKTVNAVYLCAEFGRRTRDEYIENTSGQLLTVTVPAVAGVKRQGRTVQTTTAWVAPDPRQDTVTTANSDDPWGASTPVVYTAPDNAPWQRTPIQPIGWKIVEKIQDETCVPSRGSTGTLSDVGVWSTQRNEASLYTLTTSTDSLYWSFLPHTVDPDKNPVTIYKNKLDVPGQVIDSITISGSVTKLDNSTMSLDPMTFNNSQLDTGRAIWYTASTWNAFTEITYDNMFKENPDCSTREKFYVAVSPGWNSDGSLWTWKTALCHIKNVSLRVTVKRHIPECGTTYIPRKDRVRFSADSFNPNPTGSPPPSYGSPTDLELCRNSDCHGWERVQGWSYSPTYKFFEQIFTSPNANSAAPNWSNIRWRKVDYNTRPYRAPTMRVDTVTVPKGADYTTGISSDTSTDLESKTYGGTWVASGNDTYGNPGGTRSGVPQNTPTTNIPWKDYLAPKPAYDIKAKATYTDIYCSKVVKISDAKEGYVPYYDGFANKWSPLSTKTLTPAQVRQMSIAGEKNTTNPFVLKRTLALCKWEGSKTARSSHTASTAHEDRYGYSPNEVSASISSTRIHSLPVVSASWPTDTRPDREHERLKTLAADSSSNVYGMLIGAEDVVTACNVHGAYAYKPEQMDTGLSNLLINETTSSLEKKLTESGTSNDTKVPNFSLDSSHYTGATSTSPLMPPIPFARHYGVLTSMDGTSTFSTSTPENWFSSSRLSSDDRYPVIYSEKGEAGRFTFETTATAAPIIRMRFFIDVTNDQLPIRELTVDWGDTASSDRMLNIQAPTDKSGVGGIVDRPYCGAITANCKPFELNHVFKNRKIAGNTVCIKARDNWERVTQVCGTLGTEDNTFSSLQTTHQ